ncbi:uncharacterized protein [Ptychodera flava]|uniref:uncharacterized protein n=1 Tax=Ptychodera flava TaxID=63121 RepID=UPI00396AAE5A
MAECQVPSCKNKVGKASGKSFFQIPDPTKSTSNIQLAEKWLENIGVKHSASTFKFSRNKVVCEDHFHQDCFQRNLQAELLNYKPKRKLLKVGAVPTIFSDGSPKHDGMMSSETTSETCRYLEEINVNFVDNEAGEANWKGGDNRKQDRDTCVGEHFHDVATQTDPVIIRPANTNEVTPLLADDNGDGPPTKKKKVDLPSTPNTPIAPRPSVPRPLCQSTPGSHRSDVFNRSELDTTGFGD